jgi:L-serine deaminase
LQKEALESARAVLALESALAQTEEDDREARDILAFAYGHVSGALHKTNDHAGALEYAKKAAAIHQALAKAEPADQSAQRSAADGQRWLGVLHKTLGADYRLEMQERLDHWRAAREAFQSAWDVMTTFENSTIFSDFNRPEALAAEISRCEAALAELRSKK